MPEPRCLILTRPAAQAAGWLAALQAEQVPVQNLPLIDTPSQPEAAARAREQLAAFDWAFFTSPAAVAAVLGPGFAWPDGLSATCVGPGTAAALRAAGVPSAQLLHPPADAAQFDSEQLWPLLQAAGPWSGRRLLWLSGDGGRDWLQQRLREQGAEVQALPVYRRVIVQHPPAELALQLATPALWLFSSSEALQALHAQQPQADWSALQALATHPRIADTAAGFGLRCTVVAPQPLAVAQAWRLWSGSAAS